jgi:hypothetical protein
MARSLRNIQAMPDTNETLIESPVSQKSISVENREKGNASDRTARLTAIAGENTLKKIWDTPEEDEAWQHL